MVEENGNADRQTDERHVGPAMCSYLHFPYFHVHKYAKTHNMYYLEIFMH